MRILCNHPLESFEPRERYRDVELLTFGPKDRMWVGKRFYPFDLEFDPSRGTWEQLRALLPPGWEPDLILFYYPEHEPLPRGIEKAPYPVVGVISDWNLHFDQLWTMAPFFDAVAADRTGTGIFAGAGFARTFYWPQYTFRWEWHRPVEGLERDIDVSFVGNLNPQVQGDRVPWLERLARLKERGVRVEIATGVFNEEYGRILARSKIGFNRSIRREMNLRAFEVCASGALLLMERENLEVREYLAPGEEVVLYGEDDLEEKILRLLERDEERERIARAGRKKILDYSMSRNLDRLRGALAGIRAGARPPAPEWRLHLARGTAMLRTWASHEAVLADLVRAASLNPTNPQVRNNIGAVLAAFWPMRAPGESLREFLTARTLSPRYLPALLNLVFVMAALGREKEARAFCREAEERAEQVEAWEDLQGLVLPLGYEAKALDLRRKAALSVLEGSPRDLASLYAVAAREALVSRVSTART